MSYDFTEINEFSICVLVYEREKGVITTKVERINLCWKEKWDNKFSSHYFHQEGNCTSVNVDSMLDNDIRNQWSSEVGKISICQ